MQDKRVDSGWVMQEQRADDGWVMQGESVERADDRSCIR